MDKIAWVSLPCLALGACATPVQTAGTTSGVVAGTLVGGPVGAVVNGAAGAVITSPVIGYPRYGYRCYYHDRYGYGYVHYHRCR